MYPEQKNQEVNKICPSDLSIRDIKNRCWEAIEEAEESLEKKKKFKELNDMLMVIYEGDSQKRNNEELLEIIQTNNFLIKDWVDDKQSGLGEDISVRESLFRSLIKYNEISEDDVFYLLSLPKKSKAGKPTLKRASDDEAGQENIDLKMKASLSSINPMAGELKDIV